MKFFNFGRNNKDTQRRIHLDYAATTPVHKDVLDAMKPYWSERWANASAIYKEGVKVREKIEVERERLARSLHVRPSGITFTSGGTESNNLALYGTLRALVSTGKEFSDIEIITSQIEHPSIQEVANHLSELGVTVKYAPIDEKGSLDLVAFKKLLSKKTAIASFAYVNSETGVIQDIKKISRIVRKWNEAQGASVIVHTDACQAPLWLSCALDSLGVDIMSLDSGKCYGPKSSGVLAHKHGINLLPILLGGNQEEGLRAGTENVALITGCVSSIVRAQNNYKSLSNSISEIRDYGLEKTKSELPNAVVNGSIESRVANNINISLPGIDSEYAVIVLDKHGVAASTKSACGVGKGVGSEVIRKITKDEARATSTIRFTLGEESTKDDLDYAISVLKNHVKMMNESLRAT